MGKMIDMKGEKVGRLLVVGKSEIKKDNKICWICTCDCGKEVVVSGKDLRSGAVKSCGCYRKEVLANSKVIDIAGMKFNHLLVIGPSKKFGGCRHWFCQCELCGELTVVRTGDLKSGAVKSCGCLFYTNITKANRKHGMSGVGRPSIYSIWATMLDRCRNENNKNYKNYGGRGISVCERWYSFENFYADMGDRPENLSIDRINNDGNYEPGNCRWATHKEQMNNTRRWRDER